MIEVRYIHKFSGMLLSNQLVTFEVMKQSKPLERNRNIPQVTPYVMCKPLIGASHRF